MNHIITGLGYGDEGKGHFTNFVAGHRNALVVRFNGGAQAGHTVVLPDGRRHVFSHFGSGTLIGKPTFWSKFCPVSPPALKKEYEALRKLRVHPRLWLDPFCPVVTIWDVLANRIAEDRRIDRHGSCGSGFGPTIERTENSPYKMFICDLQGPEVLIKHKLNAIRSYYLLRQGDDYFDIELSRRNMNADQIEAWWIEQSKDFPALVMPWLDMAANQKEIVFEGAQGTLLDMDHGFFPHVTRSNTTCKNAVSLIKEANREFCSTTFYGITRCYSTRHGAGPFPGNEHPIHLINNENETNVFNQYQQDFKTAIWNIDITDHAIGLNGNYLATGLKQYQVANVITCIDQISGDTIPAILEGELIEINKKEIDCAIESCAFLSYGPTPNDIKCGSRLNDAHEYFIEQR